MLFLKKCLLLKADLKIQLFHLKKRIIQSELLFKFKFTSKKISSSVSVKNQWGIDDDKLGEWAEKRKNTWIFWSISEFIKIFWILI